MPVPQSWHSGEIAAQAARGFEDDVWGAYEMYQEGAPDWMALFLSQLPFLSVTTLDAEGRPWTSLVCNDGRAGFIQPVTLENGDGGEALRFTIRAASGVPIRECLDRLNTLFRAGQSAFDDQGVAKIQFCVGAVGVMLHNRRRNKLEGVIVDVERLPVEEGDDDFFVFILKATNTFGNCPKYIQTRFLAPTEASVTQEPVLRKGNGSDGDIPVEVLKHIAQADLVYLATKHSGNDPATYMPDPPRLGNNHRGGPAGFLRTYWDEEQSRRCVVLPDWSGNRMMMSFGNMIKDPVAGITIPVWSDDARQAGSLVHFTCTAQVLAGEEVKTLMRGVGGAVKLWIEAWSYTQYNFPVYVAPVELEGMKDNVGWSPYNPPIRMLNSEMANVSGNLSNRTNAQMVDATFWSDELATFRFAIQASDSAKAIAHQYRFGQHIIVDCYDLLDTRIQMYSHMARFRGGEKDLNDDGTRSWTVTYAEAVQDQPWHFELTLRRKQRGGVTPTLFGMGRRVREAIDEGLKPPSGGMKMNVLGIDGSTVLPIKTGPRKLVYLLSGIGLTPLLPHLTQLLSTAGSEADVLAVIATRSDETQAVQHIVHNTLTRAASQSKGTVRLTLYLIVSRQGGGESTQADLIERELWRTLPPTVMASVHCVQGKRLTQDSLAQSDAQDSDTTFFLPREQVAKVKDAEAYVVCAAPAFAQTARQALAQHDVADEKIHMESFAF